MSPQEGRIWAAFATGALGAFLLGLVTGEAVSTRQTVTTVQNALAQNEAERHTRDSAYLAQACVNGVRLSSPLLVPVR